MFLQHVTTFKLIIADHLSAFGTQNRVDGYNTSLP